ncbi:MAG: WHG domain-containing protein [Acetobacteraceae bacterium]|nr:WHG domain-containing protein [Acetobacteraceae bacterium]
MTTSAPAPRAPSAYHHGDLRRGLLDAAESLLERDRGPAALSLREVARAAGVSHNAPYRHFADREALLAALAAEGFVRLTAALHAAARRSHAEARGLALGRAYLRFARTHPSLYLLMFGPDVRKSAYPALAAAAMEAFAALRPAAGAGRDPARRARHHAVGAWALAHGLAHLIVDRQLADDFAADDYRALIEDVLEAYDGIRSAPAFSEPANGAGGGEG